MCMKCYIKILREKFVKKMYCYLTNGIKFKIFQFFNSFQFGNFPVHLNFLYVQHVLKFHEFQKRV